MDTLHTVYRCTMEEPGRWRGYVVGLDTIIDADNLPRAREELEHRLLTRLTAWPRHGLIEHTEHALGDGLWVREALDERVLERGHTTRVITETLHDQRLRRELTALPESGAGGVILLASVPGDNLGWVRDQHDGHGALVVATAITNHQLWWNALTPPGRAADALPHAGSLTELDLTSPQSTIDEWMTIASCGRTTTVDVEINRATGPN